MNKTLIFLSLLLLLLSQVWSQDFDNYQPLKAQGIIPADFLGSATEKFEASLKTIKQNSDSRERRIKERFYLESNFGIDELLLSGRVLFNDPMSDYINRVADEILKEEPELRKKLRFYILKSPIPNAFTTNQGIIFVNMGLLPRLDNEAQLAFILCHEISHFVEKHIIDGYVTSAEIDLEKGEYQSFSMTEKLMLKNLYSQNHEMIADMKGLEMFLKTDYNPSEIPAVFDILKNAEKPHISPKQPEQLFKNSEFSHNEYESYLAIKAEEEQGEALDWEEEKVDTTQLATHPSPEKRREVILTEISKRQPTGKASFLVSSSVFEQVQQMANFELCEIYLESVTFHDALHHTMALQEFYPNSTYLKFALVKALYGKAKYRLAEERPDNYMSYRQPEGEYDYFYEYTTYYDKNEIAVTALSYAWNYFEMDSTNLHAKKIVEDLVIELLEEYPYLETTDDLIENPIKDFFALIKSKPAFVSIYDKCLMKRKLKEYYNTSVEAQKRIANREQINLNKGDSLGIDKVVIFAPFHLYLNFKDEAAPTQHLVSEEQQKRMHEYILSHAYSQGLNVEILDAKRLVPHDIEKFNDLSITYAWYYSLVKSEVKLIPANYLEILNLSKKYGTPYFANMGAIWVRTPSLYRQYPERILFTLILPLAPLLIYVGAKPHDQNLFYTVLFDVKDNTPKMIYKKYKKGTLKDERLNNKVYKVINQIKRKPGN